MTKEQKRLEKALLDLIERESKKPSSDETLRIIPQTADVLVKLWATQR